MRRVAFMFAYGAFFPGEAHFEKIRDCVQIAASAPARFPHFARGLASIVHGGLLQGRGNVPIDLATYRELIAWDLLIDKGRRLTLTRLGVQVYRFLT